MSDRGHVIHAPWCNVPLNEHSGNEACLEWKPEEVSTLPVVAHYKQGPQGNLIADYRADWLAYYGGSPPKLTRPLGTSEIQDRRDTRDPVAVGEDFLAQREAERAVENGHPVTYPEPHDEHDAFGPVFPA